MLSQDDPFYSSKYLIRRAKKHTDEFKAVFAGFIKPDPYIRVVEYDADTGEDVYKIKLNKPVPEDLAGIGFDAVSNLRAALDSAIFTITKSKLGDRVMFPISDTTKNLPAAANFEKRLQSNLTDKGVPPELVNIVRGSKAYEGGNKLLWALKELRDANNHSVVIPATTVAWGLSAKPIYGDIQFNICEWDSVKDEMIYDRSPHGPKHEPNIGFTLLVSFADINYICFEEAVTVLDKFVNEVEGLVMAIEAEAMRIGWF